jgi:hypothetical protein
LQRIEKDALAERKVGDGHSIDPQLGEHLLEQDGATEDDVGALGVEAFDLDPLFDGAQLGEGFHHLGQFLDGELEVAQRAYRIAAALRLDHLRDVEDRARAAHRDLEAASTQLPRHRPQVRAHELPAVVDIAAAQRLVAEEALGEADGAELEAARLEHATGPAENELGAAAADVDQHDLLIEDGHRLQHTQVDEPGLLDPGDHLDLDAGLRPGALEEDVAVLRFAHGTRRDRVHSGAGDLRHLAEALQRLDAAVDGRRLQHLHVARARAQAHHLLLAVDDLEAGAVEGARHEQVDRVRADVDGREGVLLSHARTLPHRLSGPGHVDPGDSLRKPALGALTGAFRVDERGQSGVHSPTSTGQLPLRLEPAQFRHAPGQTLSRPRRAPHRPVLLEVEERPRGKRVAAEPLDQLSAQGEKRGPLLGLVAEAVDQSAPRVRGRVRAPDERLELEHRRPPGLFLRHAPILPERGTSVHMRVFPRGATLA